MSRRISDLINGKPTLRIKDYAKIEYIFILYLKEFFDTMSREIYWYKASEFWVDIQLYLNGHFSEKTMRFYKHNIEDEFFVREDAIWYENDLKKAKRKYRL